MEQRNIKKEWILFTVNNPDTTEVIDDDEIHYFKISNDFSNKCLKVIVNPINNIIVTAHFDRNKTKRGLK
jgi:hypothetical protein